MHSVMLRDVAVGAGMPKLVVPIVAANREELLAQGQKAASGPADVAEWRADFYPEALDPSNLLAALSALRGALGNMPLLFTLRTKAQGGASAVDPGLYAVLCATAAHLGEADAVDVELTDEMASHVVDAVHAVKKPVIGSWHDLTGTEPREKLLERLRAMRETGADILKLALTPRDRKDVLTLLGVTEEASRMLDCPIVTVSMSPLGSVSRVCGGAFGSAMTFGTFARPTDAGQLPVGPLRAALEMLYGEKSGFPVTAQQ